MKYLSTRDKKRTYCLSEALSMGLAPDGGLIIPEKITPIKNIEKLKELDYPSLASRILSQFFQEDDLLIHLDSICQESFNFPVKIKKLDEQIAVLELFHGPTEAFKDFGARFLANCLEKLGQEKTILVATSGDTGGAVASAFYNKKNIKVGILFPEKGVSSEQFKQLTCWGNNILSIAIDGTFDDCQEMVKSSFKENKIKNLTSANSINIGRLLAQTVYYCYASLQGHKNFIIPSGNIGNSMGCFWAKKLGLPIEKIVLTTNSNKAVSFYQKTKEIKKFKTIKTIANAMDVGLPSNLERLDYYKENFSVHKVSDKEIISTIKKILDSYNYLIDPHTATALNYALKSEDDFLAVSTASPVKFKESLIEHIPKVRKLLEGKEISTRNGQKVLYMKKDLNQLIKIINNFN